MFNVVSSALRKTTKKKDEKSTKDKAEIRLVTSGETHKNEVGIVDMPSHDELKKSFEELLVCSQTPYLHKPSSAIKFNFDIW